MPNYSETDNWRERLKTVRREPVPPPLPKYEQIIEPRLKSIPQFQVVNHYKVDLLNFGKVGLIVVCLSFLAQNPPFLWATGLFLLTVFFISIWTPKPTKTFESKSKIIDQPTQKVIDLDSTPQAPLGAPTPPVAPQDPPKKMTLAEKREIEKKKGNIKLANSIQNFENIHKKLSGQIDLTEIKI